jgi:cytochrome c peroxidase
MRIKRIIALLTFCSVIFGCSSDGSIDLYKHEKEYNESLDELAHQTAIIKFGEKLFFDPILSKNGTVSCANCHHPSKAFTDGNPLAIGIDGRKAPRNSPTLTNLASHPHFMMDGGNATLEIQALTPLRDSNEMGSNMKELIEKLRRNKEYNALSNQLFDKDIDAFVLTRALAAFEKNITSFRSPFDEWYYNKNENAVSEEVKEGFRLFDEQLNCTACHTPPYFTNFKFENNGLLENYTDLGRYMVSADSNDMSAFKVPTLRNISLTAPYLHNGSIETLKEIINRYEHGGFKHPTKNERIQPLDISEKEKVLLIQFLNSLTDTSFIQNLDKDHQF